MKAMIVAFLLAFLIFGAVSLASITISSVNVSGITNNSVNISWLTDAFADGNVSYGLTNETNQSLYDGAFITDHLTILHNLYPNTFYHFYLKSCFLEDCVEDRNNGEYYGFTTLGISATTTTTMFMTPMRQTPLGNMAVNIIIIVMALGSILYIFSIMLNPLSDPKSWLKLLITAVVLMLIVLSLISLW